jgi:hypothetical protein
MSAAIALPLTLPCGAVLANRISKGAMTEGLATLSVFSAWREVERTHKRVLKGW